LIGEWAYPQGAMAPAAPAMDTFPYRDSKNGRFVLDFWVKNGPTKLEANSKKITQSRDQARRDAEKLTSERRAIQERDAKEIANLADIGRFCQEPFQNGKDLFLSFYPLHERLNLSKFLPTQAPDENYPYLRPEAKNEDADYARLAYQLYDKKKFALVLKTLDFHRDAVRKSEFARDLRFLRANAIWQLNQKPEAEREFAAIRDEQVGHPSSLFSAIYLANQAREKEDFLPAYEGYLWIGQKYPEHEKAWVFRLIAAEMLYEMRQMDRAEAEYDWLIKNSPTREGRALAATRIGNVFLYRRQYAEAIAAYFRAQKDYPEESKKSAFLTMNRADALYWMGGTVQSETTFLDILKKFPENSGGWRALVRLGELTGRKAVAKHGAESRSFFLEAINRYPFSPGTVLARMRLIPCGDHAGFTAETAKLFFEGDARSYTGAGEVRVDDYPAIRAIYRVKSLILFKSYQAALDAVFEEKEQLPRQSPVLANLEDIQRRLFRKNIVELLDANKTFEAAKFYDDRIDRMPMSPPESDGSEAINPEYLLRLSRGVSAMGLGTLAQKIYDKYAELQTGYEVTRFSETRQEKRLGLDARKQSERAFTLAKALATEDRKKNAAEIRKQLAQVSGDSPYSFQRFVLESVIDADSGKTQSALAAAEKARLLLGGIKGDYTVEAAGLDQWIADLQLKTGAKYAAIEIYAKIAERYPEAGSDPGREPSSYLSGWLPPLQSKDQLMQNQADIYASLGKWVDAANVYERAISSGVKSNRVRYEFARALMKSNPKDSKAIEVLNQLAESKETDFWTELARKSIAGLTAKEGN